MDGFTLHADIDAKGEIDTPYCSGTLTLQQHGQMIKASRLMIYVAVTLLMDGVRQFLLRDGEKTFEYKSPNTSFTLTISKRPKCGIEIKDIHGASISTDAARFTDQLLEAARGLLKRSEDQNWRNDAPVLDLQDALVDLESTRK